MGIFNCSKCLTKWTMICRCPDEYDVSVCHACARNKTQLSVAARRSKDGHVKKFYATDKAQLKVISPHVMVLPQGQQLLPPGDALLAKMNAHLAGASDISKRLNSMLNEGCVDTGAYIGIAVEYSTKIVEITRDVQSFVKPSS